MKRRALPSLLLLLRFCRRVSTLAAYHQQQRSVGCKNQGQRKKTKFGLN